MDMREQWPRDDGELLCELQEAVHARAAVPARWGEAARAAYVWRTMDAELAALTYDSVLVAGSPPVLREDEALLRNLTFVATDLTVEVEVDARGLIGQVVPPAPGELEVETVEGPGSGSAIDALGCFSVRPLPPGAFRLHVRTTDGTSALTSWIRLGEEPAPGPAHPAP